MRDVLLLITSIHDYIDGCYHDVSILSYTNLQTFEKIELNTMIPEINENRDESNQLESTKIFILFSKKREYDYLRIALQDLGLCIKYPKDTPYFCFRAMEALRKFFNEKKESKGWNMLYKELNISPSLKKELAKRAGEIRHGGNVVITSEDREKVIKNAWKIVDRFVIYALNGEQTLDKSSYGELKFE